jgi:hypothetical protein
MTAFEPIFRFFLIFFSFPYMAAFPRDISPGFPHLGIHSGHHPDLTKDERMPD